MKAVSRQTAFKCAALLASVVFALLAGEVICRVLAALDRNTYQSFQAYQRPAGAARSSLIDYIQPSAFPDMVYDLIPNAEGPGLGEYLQAPIRINSDGMRDRECPIAKPVGVFRIALLGDSLAFGWGVRVEDCYAKVLERLLNSQAAPGVGFEVLNFGIPGYNTPMEAALYEHKARKYEPDLVVIHHVANDHQLPNFLVSRLNPFSLRESFLWERLRGARPGPRLVDAPRQTDAQGRPYAGFPEDRIPQAFRSLQGFAAVDAALEKLARLTQEDGAAVAQLVAPSELTPAHLQTRKAPPEELGAYFRLGAQRGFLEVDATGWLVDGLREFGLQQNQYWIWPWDQHPNEIAHQIIAWALGQSFRRMAVFNGRLANSESAAEEAWRAAVRDWIAREPWQDKKRAGR